jgi:hypothetical protein
MSFWLAGRGFSAHSTKQKFIALSALRMLFTELLLDMNALSVDILSHKSFGFMQEYGV